MAGNQGDDGEVDLIELAIVLWRHKWLILGSMALCCLLGLGYASYKPQLGTYTTVIGLPTAGDDAAALYAPTQALELLQSVYVPAALKAQAAPADLAVQVEHPKSTTLIKLKTRASRNAEGAVRSIHEAVTQALAAYSAEQVQNVRNGLEAKISHDQSQLELLHKLGQGPASRSSDQLSFSMATLNDEISQARQKLGSISHQKTFELARIDRSTQAPSRTLSAMLGMVLGLFFGLFLAMVLAFVAAVKTRMNQEISVKQ